MGRPNVPVRMLAGMMILKESSGWSDERLFEEIEFNILAMSALGMNNASDEAPCAATYYNFRKALYEYQLQTVEDSSKYHLIVRVLSEQYRIEGEQVRLCEIREIKGDSLQSPHDEDAA